MFEQVSSHQILEVIWTWTVSTLAEICTPEDKHV